MTKYTPNNFPREGAHRPITREYLEQLKAHRAIPNQTLDYTIGGTRETVVHTNIESQRNYTITQGEKRLKQVSENLQYAQSFSANNGRAKGPFKKACTEKKTDAEKEYIAKQRKIMHEAQKNITHTHER